MYKPQGSLLQRRDLLSQMFEGNGARLGSVRRWSGVRVLPCIPSVSAALFASSQANAADSQVLQIEETFSRLCILVPTSLAEKILNMCGGADCHNELIQARGLL